MRLLMTPIVVALFALAGCGSDPVPISAATPSGTAPEAVAPNSPRAELAARAAAAKDLRQVAFYVLKSAGRPDRTVGVTRAVDGSWRIDIPGGAHGGAVDIALAYVANALHQCVLPQSGCVRVDGQLPASADPRVEHLFTDWLDILMDRQQALAVSIAQPLEGAAGECYAIESSAVSLLLPIDVGIYCYDTDGTLTAARLGFGTMVLAGKPGGPPPTLALPGPVVSGQLLTLAAPPTPSASPSSMP